MSELLALLVEVENDPIITGLVLTGLNRSFSIGGNTGEIFSLVTEADRIIFFRLMDELILKAFSFKKPLVSAVSGHAIGLGFLLMLCSDYCICIRNEKIKFGLPEITIGMTIDDSMVEVLKFNGIVGKKLSHLILTGELFDINIAKENYLIDSFAENAEESIRMSEEQISKYLKYGIVAFDINKRMIRKQSVSSITERIKCECYRVFLSALDRRS
jgi:3-hydroxyacyl-CoA dehydrogenase/enoyl-CoA hydratase/3-hydroxybutyryl-CoA epimerase